MLLRPDGASFALAADRLEADKTAYPRYIKRTADGEAIFNSKDCVEFMTLVSGLPTECCLAWVEKISSLPGWKWRLFQCCTNAAATVKSNPFK
jgi:hypothetical protein